MMTCQDDFSFNVCADVKRQIPSGSEGQAGGAAQPATRTSQAGRVLAKLGEANPQHHPEGLMRRAKTRPPTINSCRAILQ